MFEDIGHSSEARSKLKNLLVGPLEIDPSKPREGKVKGSAASLSSEGGGGLPIAAIVVVVLAIIIYFVYAPK